MLHIFPTSTEKAGTDMSKNSSLIIVFCSVTTTRNSSGFSNSVYQEKSTHYHKLIVYRAQGTLKCNS